MTRKSKKYQLLVSALLLCFLQVAGIDVYAQSTVTPARKDTTIIPVSYTHLTLPTNSRV